MLLTFRTLLTVRLEIQFRRSSKVARPPLRCHHLVLVVLFEHTILKLVEFDKVSEVADKADPPDFSFILLELKFISDS